jgi:hypothetical protein
LSGQWVSTEFFWPAGSFRGFALSPVCAPVLLEKANNYALGTKCFASCELRAAAGAHQAQNFFSEMCAQQVLTLLSWIDVLSHLSSVISAA